MSFHSDCDFLPPLWSYTVTYGSQEQAKHMSSFDKSLKTCFRVWIFAHALVLPQKDNCSKGAIHLFCKLNLIPLSAWRTEVTTITLLLINKPTLPTIPTLRYVGYGGSFYVCQWFCLRQHLPIRGGDSPLGTQIPIRSSYCYMALPTTNSLLLLCKTNESVTRPRALYSRINSRQFTSCVQCSWWLLGQ